MSGSQRVLHQIHLVRHAFNLDSDKMLIDSLPAQQQPLRPARSLPAALQRLQHPLLPAPQMRHVTRLDRLAGPICSVKGQSPAYEYYFPDRPSQHCIALYIDHQGFKNPMKIIRADAISLYIMSRRNHSLIWITYPYISTYILLTRCNAGSVW